jgi:hypothetical protein
LAVISLTTAVIITSIAQLGSSLKLVPVTKTNLIVVEEQPESA